MEIKKTQTMKRSVPSLAVIIGLAVCFYMACWVFLVDSSEKSIDQAYTRSVALRLQGGISDNALQLRHRISENKNLSFDTVYINLDKKINRGIKLKTALDEQGFNSQRFNAIDGQKLDIRLLRDLGVVDQQLAMAMGLSNDWMNLRKRDQFKSGQLGVILSHILAMAESLNQTSDYLLVLEDDVMLPKKFHQIVQEVTAQLSESDFDLVQLSGQNNKKFCQQSKFQFLHQKICRGSLDPSRVMQASTKIQTAKFSMGAWAYVIKKSSIPKYVRHFSLPLLQRPSWLDQQAPIKYWGPLDIYQWLFEDVKIGTVYPTVIDVSDTESWLNHDSTSSQ